MNIALFWNIYQSRTLDLLQNCLSDGQDGGCKQRGQTVTIWIKALLMPRLAVCSRDLHWHWISWTLLCDTMEVSMLRLAWLPIAQNMFQPALTCRLELISRKIVSSEQEQRLSRWADFAKNCLPRIECKELPRFREKYGALVRYVCKIREIGGQKNVVQHATAIYTIPRYTRPRYIGLTLYHDPCVSCKSPALLDSGAPRTSEIAGGTLGDSLYFAISNCTQIVLDTDIPSKLTYSTPTISVYSFEWFCTIFSENFNKSMSMLMFITTSANGLCGDPGHI